MKIMSFKPGHDGTIAVLDGNKLLLSLEAEKDSFPRQGDITPSTVLNAMSYLDDIPDVVALSGWSKHIYLLADGPTGLSLGETPLGAGYFGVDESTISTKKMKFLGKQIEYFTSSHERSHLLGVYGMSPFEQGEPCYVLVWEGLLGNFYEIDANVQITKLGQVLAEPGFRYASLFGLADPTFSLRDLTPPGLPKSFPPMGGNVAGSPQVTPEGAWLQALQSLRFPLREPEGAKSFAGKLMALASFSDYGPPTEEERELIESILDTPSFMFLMFSPGDMTGLAASRFANIGVEHPDFKNVAGKFSNALFDRFYEFARVHLTKKHPLLIAGGCGLNCDWNTKWRQAGLFPEVFVPPCTNDSGSAIGTAVDAQFHYTGNAKISWDVYAGEDFVNDIEPQSDEFDIFPLDYRQVAAFLQEQKVIAWVQGRYEIGPRALGNRSILAAPFEEKMHARLNYIKQREGYRPIAPICREEDVSEYFEWTGPSPYMLYFQKVKTDKLPAITHVDNTARAETVNIIQNAQIYELLTEFKKLTGFSVLCNTSLNFKEAGFINTMSDLIAYCKARSLDGFVVQDKFYVPRA